MTDQWFIQNAENVPLLVVQVTVNTLPHLIHDLPLAQAIHHHVLRLQVILTVADLRPTHLNPDLYHLACQVHIHDLRFHLPAVHHQLVPSLGQRKQRWRDTCMTNPTGLWTRKSHQVLRN